MKPIPLYPNTKKPIESGWNVNWEIEHIRDIFESRETNMGLLLGNIIDVEGDTDLANNILISLVGDYPHPSYTGSKSQHHLFLNPDPNLTRIAINGIEFRAYKHQSVIPPSIHPDGTKYTWVSDFFPVPEMPPRLLQFFNNIKSQRGSIIKSISRRQKIPRSCVRPWCSKCRKREIINQRRYFLEVEAFKSINLKWQCKKCRRFDIRNICRKLKSVYK